MPKQNSDTKAKKEFVGKTSAYISFHENIWKTEQLLEIGLSGISERAESINGLIKIFDSVQGIRGPWPKDYKTQAERLSINENGEIQPDENGVIQLKMDQRSAWLMKKAFEDDRLKHAALRFHLYAILAVTIWGTFETYIIMLYEELYRKRPEILKSDENVTIRDILEHQDTIVDFLIERQMDKIGHFTILETLKYLKTKFSFEFASSRQQKLIDYYLVRNIVAHNMGIVQGSVRNKLPNTIIIKDNQIQVTKAFLEGMIRDIQASVISIEKFIDEKFF